LYARHLNNVRFSVLRFIPNRLFKTRETSWAGNVHIRKRKLQFVGEEFKGGTTVFSGAIVQHGPRLLIVEVSRSYTIIHTHTR